MKYLRKQIRQCNQNKSLYERRNCRANRFSNANKKNLTNSTYWWNPIWIIRNLQYFFFDNSKSVAELYERYSKNNAIVVLDLLSMLKSSSSSSILDDSIFSCMLQQIASQIHGWQIFHRTSISFIEFSCTSHKVLVVAISPILQTIVKDIEEKSFRNIQKDKEINDKIYFYDKSGDILFGSLEAIQSLK